MKLKIIPKRIQSLLESIGKYYSCVILQKDLEMTKEVKKTLNAVFITHCGLNIEIDKRAFWFNLFY